MLHLKNLHYARLLTFGLLLQEHKIMNNKGLSHYLKSGNNASSYIQAVLKFYFEYPKRLPRSFFFSYDYSLRFVLINTSLYKFFYQSYFHRRMPSNLIKVLLLIFLVTSTNSQIQYITFNVNPVSLTRANFYLNILTNQIQTYNWIYCNKPQLFNTISNTLMWLRQVRNGLPYGNLISGSGNMVAGNNNVVIGNKNIVAGINNWVFVSNYKGQSQIEDSILAIGNYQINLKKLNDILINPTLAISPINGTVYQTLCSQSVAAGYFFS